MTDREKLELLTWLLREVEKRAGTPAMASRIMILCAAIIWRACGQSEADLLATVRDAFTQTANEAQTKWFLAEVLNNPNAAADILAEMGSKR